jgi:hypothetical protein
VHYANVRVMPIGRGEAARVAVGAVMGSA